MDDDDNESGDETNRSISLENDLRENCSSDEEFEFDDAISPQAPSKRTRKSTLKANEGNLSGDDNMDMQSCTSEEEFEFEDEDD